MMEITARFEMDNAEEILGKRGVMPYGPVQKYVDNEVIRQCEPYVPAQTNYLATSAYGATDIGSGMVVYPGPYAHYQYMGEVYGPNIPMIIGGELAFRSPPGQIKYPTGRPIQYSKEVHPMAGSRWLERMKADHADDILEGARKVAGAK